MFHFQVIAAVKSIWSPAFVEMGLIMISDHDLSIFCEGVTLSIGYLVIQCGNALIM